MILMYPYLNLSMILLCMEITVERVGRNLSADNTPNDDDDWVQHFSRGGS